MRSALTRVMRLVGRWSLAHALIRLEEYAFDFLLYPFMLYRGGGLLVDAARGIFGGSPAPSAGYWTGFGVLLFLSVLGNAAYISLYDRFHTDWFGFEEAKRLAARWAGQTSLHAAAMPARAAALLYFSIWHGPLFAVLSARPADRYAMRAPDWGTFAAAVLIANLAWTGLVTGTGSFLLPIFRRILGI